MKNIRNLTTARTPIYSGNKEPEKAHSRALKRLEDWNTTNSRNKEFLRKFTIHLAGKRDRQRRIMKLIPQLIMLSDWSGLTFEELTHEEIALMRADIYNNSKWADATRCDYVRALKSLMLWWEELDPRVRSEDKEIQQKAFALYRYLHKQVTTTYKQKELDPADIIRQEDYDILVKHCNTPYEEATLAILFYTGLRISEILELRWKDIVLTPSMGYIRVVDGKTGSRDVPILEAIAPIMKLKQSHPDRENDNALILISLNNKFRYKPLRYIGVYKMVQRIFERAEYLVREEPTREQIKSKTQPKIKYLKKPCNLHWFRHSRATLWASQYTENLLCKLMGWASGSDQPKIYVHLCGTEVKEAFQKMNGLAEVPKKIPEIITCICGAKNNNSARYCYQCYKPLTIDIAIIDDLRKREAMNEAFKKFEEIMQNANDRAEWLQFDQTVNITPNSGVKLHPENSKEVNL
jgi:integrase